MTAKDPQEQFDAMISKSMASLPVMTPSVDFDTAVLGALGFQSRTYWATAGVMLAAAYAVAAGLLWYTVPWAMVPAYACKALMAARPVFDVGVRLVELSISSIATGPFPILIPLSAALAFGCMSAVAGPQPVRSSL